MYESLHYYMTGSLADALANEYGDRLERMTKDLKLLAINVLSGTLHELENAPCEEYSIADYIEFLESKGTVISPAFKKTLVGFDDCEASTIETLVMVLAIAVTEQR